MPLQFIGDNLGAIVSVLAIVSLAAVVAWGFIKGWIDEKDPTKHTPGTHH